MVGQPPVGMEKLFDGRSLRDELLKTKFSKLVVPELTTAGLLYNL